MEQSLYERIGGEAALSAAVDSFYQKVISDKNINAYFEGVDMNKQMRKMKSFLSYAFGAKTPFNGPNMRDAHARLVEQGLNDSHFDCVKLHLQATLNELGVEQTLVDEVLTITESTRDDVLNK
ncbi:MAG: group 1 truncated hemoglobin [Pseudomonadota bacterium]